MYAQFLLSGMTRDFNDMVKYPGRFNNITYDDTEGVIHKAMIYADTPAVNLEPVDTRITVKNMSTQNVTLTFNTIMNLWINPGTTMRSTIYPGQIASFSSLDPAVTPTLTSATAAECEVILVGFPEWPDTGPGWYCDVWAVGYDLDITKAKYVHHDSTGLWTQVVAGALIPVESECHDVGILAGGVATTGWAVGEQDAQTPEGLFTALIAGAWSELAVADDLAQYGTWGYAVNDFWSVGGEEGASGEIWHWDAVSWTVEYPGDEERCFFHCHGIATDDTWAVGEAGMVYHWDGVSWTEWDSGSFPEPAKNLFGVWQQDANNVWVCGGTSVWKGVGGVGAIYHLNVTTGVWTLSHLADDDLHGLWGFGGNDIYCVGHGDTVLHYDGAAWTAMVTPQGSGFRWRGVFGCYPWSVWACGYDSEVEDAIIHWDTVSWTTVYGASSDDKLYGIKGIHVDLNPPGGP